jgi:hypothetical protein
VVEIVDVIADRDAGEIAVGLVAEPAGLVRTLEQCG